MTSPGHAGKPGPAVELFASGSLLLLVGLIFLALWARDGYLNEFAPRFLYEEAGCRILAKGFSPAAASNPRGLGYPVFELEVRARGGAYRARGYDLWQEGISPAEAEAVLARFNVEKLHPCWFDPDDPAKAVLARTHNVSWILCGVFIVFPSVILGAVMLAFAWRAAARSSR